FPLMFLGQFDESIEQVKQSQELDPLSLIINANTGLMRYFARRFDNAIGYYRRALEMDPNFSETHWYLGMVYCPKGLYDEATRELQRVVSLSGDFRNIRAHTDTLMSWLGKKMTRSRS
ncbi:MAG: tetratricopeptide repeat protein, partial [Candidatus Aminicenantales bacterium]